MALIPNRQDVRDLLPQWNLTDEQIDVGERLVAGWLRTASGRTDVDALVDPDPLFSPALELVGLVLDNPTSLASRTAGPTSRMWPLAPRRDEILHGVRALYKAKPSGDFPCPQPWPDPSAVVGQLVRWTGGR